MNSLGKKIRYVLLAFVKVKKEIYLGQDADDGSDSGLRLLITCRTTSSKQKRLSPKNSILKTWSSSAAVMARWRPGVAVEKRRGSSEEITRREENPLQQGKRKRCQSLIQH